MGTSRRQNLMLADRRSTNAATTLVKLDCLERSAIAGHLRMAALPGPSAPAVRKERHSLPQCRVPMKAHVFCIDYIILVAELRSGYMKGVEGAGPMIQNHRRYGLRPPKGFLLVPGPLSKPAVSEYRGPWDVFRG